MKDKMTCTLYYNKKTGTPHLWQIFTGFFELQKKGFITVKLELKDWLPDSYTENLLLVDIDNQYTVIYDVNDGFDWIWGDIDHNLQYFQDTLSIQSDFYFKRSYNDELLQYNKRCKVYPLGLNYGVTSPENKLFNVHFDFKSRLKHHIRSNEWARKLLKIDGRQQYNMNNFEYIPVSQNKVPKILFLTRLWDPNTIREDLIKDSDLIEVTRKAILDINEVRVNSIIECKRLYGKQFVGGVEETKFTASEYPDLVVPYKVSNKENYLNLVKASDICIATTGINKSIGWKFAEYVAAARGIISEKLNFQVPGNFSVPSNYLEFTKVDQLLSHVNSLMDNPELLQEMMLNNYHYYNLYVRPDNLVLNTLLAIHAQAGAQSNSFLLANKYEKA